MPRSLLPLLLLTLAGSGCADGDRGGGAGGTYPTVCGNDDDCPLGQICDTSVSVCDVPPQGGGAGAGEGGGQAGDEAVGGGGEGEGEGEGESQPHVVETSPAQGARGVQTGETFRITVKFSEPMNETKVAAGIELWDDQGEFVQVLTTYDDATRTATVNPDTALEHFGVYRIKVSGEIDSADGRGMRAEEFRFSVGGDPLMVERHLALATEYAPIVFQDTTPPNNTKVKRDYIAAYDFDGAWDGDRKAEAAGSSDHDLRGGVYFSVIDSASHHFIHYVYYHPQDTDPLTRTPLRENSMKGSVVVVAKAGGGVRLIETWSPVGERLDTYGGPGTDFRLKDGVGERTLVTMEEDWLTEGKRHHAYITEQRHDSCIWDHGRSDFLEGPHCRHEARTFAEGSGIQYKLATGGRPGDVPNWVRTDDCQQECFRDGRMCRNGACELTRYQLHDLAASIWVRRVEFGDERIWHPEGEFQYNAPQARRDLGTGFSLPGKLRGDNVDKPNSGEPPWAWEDRDANDIPRGAWFIDPAWALAQRVDMPGEAWSDVYCWNPYLGIEDHTSDGCR